MHLHQAWHSHLSCSTQTSGDEWDCQADLAVHTQPCICIHEPCTHLQALL